MKHVHLSLVVSAIATLLLVGCAGPIDFDGQDAASTGAIGVGGTTGAVGAGGSTEMGGTGGEVVATGTGGATGSAGASGAGGASGVGGSGAGGNGPGGATGTAGGGGAKGTGGATGAGGAMGTGGAKGAGGTMGIGGAGAGGRMGTGGVVGTGGHVGTGGATGAGGSTGGFTASYYLGADITDQETAPDATRANLLTIMKSHGFNFIRLRTFVNPKASDGYDQTNGYDDITHTVAFGKQVKDAGMGLLIDFHYSDNWADPGKQCVPVDWYGATTIAALATFVHDYTKASITALIAGGARPDMVQIGNETTPGMLLHTCDSGGQPTPSASTLRAVNGSTSNWTNLGTLLKAGVQGVKDVDTGILISCHIDRGGDKPTDTAGAALSTSVNWVTNAMKQGVALDAFGESSYQKYQGDPNSEANTKATWTSTESGLASKFPNLKIFAAEYGPLQRDINDVNFGLPNQQGIGTFNWEPTTQGDWNTGHDLLRRSGTTYTAQPDLALYDQMKIDYAARLAP